MNKPLKISEILEAFKTFPYELEKLILSYDATLLESSYREGGWSVRELVHHLADSQMMGFMRIKWLLSEEKPHIKLYDQDRWSKLGDYLLPLEIPVSILKGLYAKWHEIVINLKTEDLAKKAYHPERGDITLFDMLAMYVNHGKHHLEQIKSVKK